MHHIRLSVLDQVPVPEGGTVSDALSNSLDLAKHVDLLGYRRLWYSEHHATALLASSAPEILIARAAAATRNIRVGSGGIMLPHYSSLKVAEVFRTLHALFPGRIDLGVGRAAGCGALETLALRRDRDPASERRRHRREDFPDQLAELLAFLDYRCFGADDPFASLRISPVTSGAPELWLLGSTMWSAETAAREALPYVYAHLFSSQGTRNAITYYHRHFAPNNHNSPEHVHCETPDPNQAKPQAAIAIGAICAPTHIEATYLYSSVLLLQQGMDNQRLLARPDSAIEELATLEHPAIADTQNSSSSAFESAEWPRYLVGTPEFIANNLVTMAQELNIGEFILNTLIHDHDARKRSYSLIAEAMARLE